MKFRALTLSVALCVGSINANDATNPVGTLAQTIEESIFSSDSPLQLTPQEIGLITNALLLLFMDAYDTLRDIDGQLSEKERQRGQVISETLDVCLTYCTQNENQQLQGILSLVKRNGRSVIKTYLQKHQAELIDDMRLSHELMNNGGKLLDRVAQVYEAELNKCVRDGREHPNMVSFFDSVYSTDQSLRALAQQLIDGSDRVKEVTRMLQQVSVNVYGLWYKVLYEGMQKHGFDSSCSTIAFTKNGLLPEQRRTTPLPSPASLMLEIIA